MKKVGIVLLVVGILVVVLSLLVDMIGIGRAPGFGYYQIGGIIIGAIVAIMGGVLMGKKHASQPS